MRKSLSAASGLIVLVLLWDFGLRLDAGSLLPSPLEVARAIGELAADGRLIRHLVASLFRVTWGFLAGVALALPVGVLLGSVRRAELAFGPLVELLQPISPLAWIPLAILWLGVGDLAAVASILVASFLPFTLAVKNAVRAVPLVHLQARPGATSACAGARW